jgi:hypothetical protein
LFKSPLWPANIQREILTLDVGPGHALRGPGKRPSIEKLKAAVFISNASKLPNR